LKAIAFSNISKAVTWGPSVQVREEEEDGQKLGRTFAAQVEALKRYRSRGDQTVRVEHVTVNEGGQAIVGNVAHRGGGNGDDGG
jgi:hypothetical protein